MEVTMKAIVIIEKKINIPDGLSSVHFGMASHGEMNVFFRELQETSGAIISPVRNMAIGDETKFDEYINAREDITIDEATEVLMSKFDELKEMD